MWCSGDVVAVRELWKGRVWKARPWIVVEDGADELVLWIPAGAPTKIPDGSGIPRDEWELRDGVFSTPALRIARPGQLHSTLLFQGETGLEWYVNLERPLRRSRIGFDYLDRELDLLARPDGTWEWLDEDEFEEAHVLDAIDPVEGAEIRAEAERVLAEWPFPTGWEDWRPDPEWPLPQLSPEWEYVSKVDLRTARLRLRPLDPSDLPWFAALHADPRTQLHGSSRGLPRPWRDSEDGLGEALEHWALHGFGTFAVLERDAPVGVVTLDFSGEGLVGIRPEEIDLGWYIVPERWGEGIAAEAARAVVEHTRRASIQPLVVRLRPANAASRRVAEKVGFIRDGAGRARNGDLVEVYRLPS